MEWPKHSVVRDLCSSDEAMRGENKGRIMPLFTWGLQGGVWKQKENPALQLCINTA